MQRSKKSVLILKMLITSFKMGLSSVVATKEWLSSQFEIMDKSEANYMLGVNIVRDRSQKLLSLSTGTYIKKIWALLYT